MQTFDLLWQSRTKVLALAACLLALAFVSAACSGAVDVRFTPSGVEVEQADGSKAYTPYDNIKSVSGYEHIPDRLAPNLVPTATPIPPVLPPSEYSLTVHQPTLNGVAHGSISPGPGTHSYLAGSLASITAYPRQGYRVGSWGLDCQGAAGNTCTVTMNGDKAANANIVRDHSVDVQTYTVTAQASANGRIEPATQTVEELSTVTLTAIPNSGYGAGAWGGGCSGQYGETCTLHVNGNKTVSVSFDQLPALQWHETTGTLEDVNGRPTYNWTVACPSNDPNNKRAAAGTVIGRVEARDPDGRVTPTYDLSGGTKNGADINATTGVITLDREFDCGSRPFHNGGTAYAATTDGRTSVAGFDFRIGPYTGPEDTTADPNNAAPTFGGVGYNADAGRYEFTVTEGTVNVGTITATDADASDSITNYVKTGSDGPDFELLRSNNVKTGEFRFRVTPDFDNPHDANGDNEYWFEIKAYSGTGSRALTATVTVKVTVTQ